MSYKKIKKYKFHGNDSGKFNTKPDWKGVEIPLTESELKEKEKRQAIIKKNRQKFKEEMNPKDERLLNKMVSQKGLWDVLDSLILICDEKGWRKDSKILEKAQNRIGEPIDPRVANMSFKDTPYA